MDAHGFLGLKLDGGRGHAGTGLLPRDAAGNAADHYSSAGTALKLRLGDNLLRYGEMTVETPVFDTGDKRLQPEYATGFLFDSRAIANLHVQAGRFTRFKNQDSSSGHGDFDGYGASTRGSAIGFAGATLTSHAPFSAALYAAQLDDTWRQGYLNLHVQQDALTLDGNLYKTLDQGAARAGAIDTLAWSLLAKYRPGPQAFTLAYQHIHGDTPFDFVGGAYNPPDPASGTAVPLQGKGGRHWERDVDLRYLLASGPAKDLSLYLSHVSHRANDAQVGADIDRLYLILEYPLKGWF